MDRLSKATNLMNSGKQWEYKTKKITPYWPRANAIVERFMRNINKVMRNSKVSGRDWRVELDIFLGHYRATPHESTGISPMKLMFKTVATTLPHSNSDSKKKIQNKINTFFYMKYFINIFLA